jgi:hypothetical protein
LEARAVGKYRIQYEAFGNEIKNDQLRVFV